MFLELDVWVFITSLIVLVPQDSNATIYAHLLTVLRVVYAIARLSSSNSEGMFCDGKARQSVDGTNRSELKLQFSLRTFAENHLPSSILGSSV